MAGNDQIVAIESDEAIDCNGSKADSHMGKAILLEVLAVFLSESVADFITEQVAVFNRNGWLVWRWNMQRSLFGWLTPTPLRS
jgi:hypothetical protein